MVIAFLLACKSYHEPFDLTVADASITRVVAQIERGDLDYTGWYFSGRFDVSGDSFGYGKNDENAQKYESGNTWDAACVPPDLVLTARSEWPHAGVDFEIDGPEVMDLALEVGGDVSLTDVQGWTYVDASTITASNLGGSGELSSDGTLDVALEAQYEGAWVMSSGGATTLRLPYGDWDVQVVTDPGQPITIENTDFDRSAVSDGFFAGISGSGAVRVEVYVTGSSFTLLSDY